MAEERRVRGRAAAVLVGSGARVVAPGYRERQQRPLVRSVVVLDEKAAQAGIEALKLAQHLVRSDRSRLEGGGNRNDQRLRAINTQRLKSFNSPLREKLGLMSVV